MELSVVKTPHVISGKIIITSPLMIAILCCLFNAILLIPQNALIEIP